MIDAVILAIPLAILALAIGAPLYEWRMRRIGVTDYSQRPFVVAVRGSLTIVVWLIAAGFAAFMCYILAAGVLVVFALSPFGGTMFLIVFLLALMAAATQT